ncbi:MAG: hypothetical protein CVV22_11205 [Ignavibacteriae bacterium HGW-Ignavibacteriae-1]|jgi:radical SAM protein with 4Fe4S-binding SPASM domain|nr:MAG: hypothetical protein CVV22_11205 [Ignavibacteriae bacterium HGW-Ignavibacteriae-1]
MMIDIKSLLKKEIRKFEVGDKFISGFKELTGKLEVPSIHFPELIGIEISSICNLSCVHCPPQTESSSPKHSMMDYDLFLKIIDEIDSVGKRRIALHKDGEPLIYPKIINVLERLKLNHEHEVYLTSNAHKLNKSISESILKNRVDIINFSLGAATEPFYKKVRGGNFGYVIKNIIAFLEMSENYKTKPLIKIQIINLPEFPEMAEELKLFKEFWSAYPVKIEEWDKLTWGLYDNSDSVSYRYPCYSLWNSMDINSDGTVSTCCMDWKHELIIGNINTVSLREVWHSESLNNLRIAHKKDNGISIEQCAGCNYWHWQPRLSNYPLSKMVNSKS